MLRFLLGLCLLDICFGGTVLNPRWRQIGLLQFPNRRIIGGVDTDISQVPYQLAVEWKGFQMCGAAIISRNYALCSALCMLGFESEEVQVRAGASLLYGGGTVIQVRNITYHPKVDFPSNDYDVTILELDTPIDFNNNSQPIPISDKEPTGGEVALVSGWGLDDPLGMPSQQLQSVPIPVVDRATCSEAFADIRILTTRMVCAGEDGKDTCVGDLGGPLVVNGSVAGIASMGLGCAEPGYYGIYTNVAHPEIRQFILDITGM